MVATRAVQQQIVKRLSLSKDPRVEGRAWIWQVSSSLCYSSGGNSYRRQSEEEERNSHKLNTFCFEVFVHWTGLGVAGGSVKVNATQEPEENNP